MSLFKLLGLISTITLLLPLVMMLVTRLFTYKSFPYLFTSYFTLFLYNLLVLRYINAPSECRLYLGILNNLLDAPLLLGFLFYFGRTPKWKKGVKLTLISFLLYEIIVLFIYGYSSETAVIVSGPGLVVVTSLALLFFIHQIKITIIFHKAAGKALIISSILFAYVGFLYVYVVFYFLNATYKQDAHVVFFMITIFTSFTISIGILLEKRRVRQLTELATTRNELKQLYSGQQRRQAPPLDAIVFRFDGKHYTGKS